MDQRDRTSGRRSEAASVSDDDSNGSVGIADIETEESWATAALVARLLGLL